MLLKVLSIAFPFGTVGPNAVGDAEQVVSRLDRALAAAGHTSLVVACEGSQTAGELFSFLLPADQESSQARRTSAMLSQPTFSRDTFSKPMFSQPMFSQPMFSEPTFSEEDRFRSSAAVQAAIDRALAAHDVDLIHLHGLDLDLYRLPVDLPVLVTLHLPTAWYRPQVWRLYNGRAQFCCLSESQRRTLPPGIRDCSVIENGVPLPPESRWPKGDFALTLGSVCPEKNAHQAFEAGTRSGTRVLLGGEVSPCLEHQQYFQDQIEPRVRSIPGELPQHAFLGRLQEHHKQALLARAKCLLHPTLAPETSSLVAMEALAAGTPVIAYPSGALPEIVDHGVTGFLIENIAEMTAALRCVHLLSSRTCREAAWRRFSAERMVERYFDLYKAIAVRRPVEVLCA